MTVHEPRIGHILSISFSELHRDPRVLRQLRCLRHLGREVIAVGHSDPQLEGVGFLSAIPPTLRTSGVRDKAIKGSKVLLGQYESLYWNRPQICHCLQLFHHIDPDLVVANDIDTLPLVVKAFPQAKILFDAHEYAPLEAADQFWWRYSVKPYREHLLRTYGPRADKMITVCQGIADKYEREFDLNADVVTNAAPYQMLLPHPIDERRIRMLYQGVGDPGRRVEDALSVMELLDERFTLDMILVPGKSTYIQKIQEQASSNPRIRFLEPVSTEKIPALCNQYDIGLYPLYPTNFNNRHALPNKFFEFVQARTALAIFPLPEMKRLVDEYSCGVVSRDFTPESLAKSLNALSTDQIEQMKHASDRAAKALCAEFNMERFASIVQNLCLTPDCDLIRS